MKDIRGIVILCVASLLGSMSHAQSVTAQDYFNQAARQYVKEDKGSALRTLDKGLREYPGDARLLKLAEELLKEQEQQDQQQAQGQGQDQKQDQEKQQEGKDQKQDQGQQKEEQQSTGKEQEKQDRSDQQKAQPGKISQQDAQRMLDAMDRQEKDVQDKVRVRQRPVQRTPVEKDW